MISSTAARGRSWRWPRRPRSGCIPGHQRRDGLGCCRRRRPPPTPRTGPPGRPRRRPFGHLVLELQHDPLGQFGAHAAGGLKGFVVPADNRQIDPVRLHHAEDGQPHLGPHAGHAGQQPETVLLFLGGKTVKADVVFRHIEDGVQGALGPRAGHGGGHAGGALGAVATPPQEMTTLSSVLFDDFTAQAIDHTLPPICIAIPPGLMKAVKWARRPAPSAG